MITDTQIFLQSNTLLSKKDKLNETEFNQPQVPKCSMLYESPTSLRHWTQWNNRWQGCMLWVFSQLSAT